MKLCAAVLPIAFALASTTACAQRFVSTGKDGSVIYSNKPPEGAAGDQAPVSMPRGADVAAYQLSGASLEEVQKDAAQKAPLDAAAGHRVWSKTTWKATWNYWTRQEGEACRIDVVSVKLKIATQLPEWHEPKDVTAADHCRWAEFVKFLRRKEEARTAQALARGRELERTIATLPPHARCEGFAAEVTALGQKLADDGKPRAQPAPAAPVLMLAKPMSKSQAKPAPPAPPKPLPIPQAIYAECKE